MEETRVEERGGEEIRGCVYGFKLMFWTGNSDKRWKHLFTHESEHLRSVLFVLQNIYNRN